MQILIPSLLLENKSLLHGVAQTYYSSNSSDAGRLSFLDAPDTGPHYVLEYSIYSQIYEFKEKTAYYMGLLTLKTSNKESYIFGINFGPMFFKNMCSQTKNFLKN